VQPLADLPRDGNATLHFQQHANAGGQLYELNVAAEQWDAIRRRINRQGGQYHRTHEDCEGTLYYVVTTVRVPGSIPWCGPTWPSRPCGTCWTSTTEQPRPVATSHGWKLPQTEERVDRYRRVGMGSRWLTLPAAADRRRSGLPRRPQRRRRQQSRCVVACDLVMRTWSDADRDYAFDCLMSGEVLPRLEGVTFVSHVHGPLGRRPLKALPW
jgi:hypothetical protein